MTAPGGLPANASAVRTAFDAAASWYLAVVDRLPDDAWDRPALGEWTVRELVAHTARAFSTIETYLEQTADEVTIDGPVAYYRAGMAIPGVNEAVAARGREEAGRLGDDPAAAIAVLAARVRPMVDATPDDTICASLVGGLRFVDYLATRVVELTVHTIDLCVAVGLDEAPPEAASQVALAVLAGLAAQHPQRADVLRALTGRGGYPEGLTVVG